MRVEESHQKLLSTCTSICWIGRSGRTRRETVPTATRAVTLTPEGVPAAERMMYHHARAEEVVDTGAASTQEGFVSALWTSTPHLVGVTGQVNLPGGGIELADTAYQQLRRATWTDRPILSQPRVRKARTSNWAVIRRADQLYPARSTATTTPAGGPWRGAGGDLSTPRRIRRAFRPAAPIKAAWCRA